MLKSLCLLLTGIGLLAGIVLPCWAAPGAGEISWSLASDLSDFVAARAVPGYEGALAKEIRARLLAYSPTTDNLGDVIVTLGEGSPRRLIVAPMDEPGYIVSGITPDGYLRLQRLPGFALLPLFNELYSAQPVGIETASGRWIPGVVAGLSIHLLPGRTNPPDPDDIANLYVDVGAAAAAKRWAAEGKTPAYIFAVDTFVSSDSPLESKRFADAPLGKGFVVRAVDGSNIVPGNLVEKVLRLARENHIPAQYGATGGGNNGSAFLRYGSVDVALGWPLRYSHSPAEEIDTRDLDALARIVTVIARNW